MTPEGKTKVEVKVILKAHKVYYHCPVQNGMGSPTLDFICCHKGLYLAIETKGVGKSLTKRQGLTASEIRAAGGTVLRIDSNNISDLSEWLTKVDETC